LCALLGVSTSSYYHAQKPLVISLEHQKLIDTVIDIHEDADKTYGKRRMRVELQAKGFDIGLYKTATLMKEAQIIAIRPRKKHSYVDHETEHRVAENILARQFNPTELNTRYVGDITYLRTHQGWTYLAAVMDLANREVVGWACGQKADARLAKQALDNAINQHVATTKSLLFHSDQGCQYTSKLFCDYLKDKQITQSMSRRGNCYDNAVMERFFRSLKTERLHNISIINHDSAMQLVEKYIRFYNYKRRHSVLGYITPAMRRKQLLNVA
jgi:putative transposase